ncbi:glycosyltransferase family 2 protein [Falsiroseomonas selenitidurans]|uniref:Glycosyltransferase family 2 protein n=1 Tax=Falsiroseomonas selenitidurans TaxID=2716335 RepID=A0ABX1E8I2_9PROT|nr:glycosyltransferase family 2 protein [Falsiroseomonas selenitidurans]NKC32082.1 glycosyltransferase family 2 protein [Falsiroseomonas selenitidurans]
MALPTGGYFALRFWVMLRRIEICFGLEDGTEQVHFLPATAMGRPGVVLEGALAAGELRLTACGAAAGRWAWPWPGTLHGLARCSPGLRYTVVRQVAPALAEFPPSLWREPPGTQPLPAEEAPGSSEIRAAGVFDPLWYGETYDPPGEPLTHYLAVGEARGLRPAEAIRPAALCFDAQRGTLAGTLHACLAEAVAMRQGQAPPAPAIALGRTGITVIIPNYQYARFVPERLGGILRQTHRVEEVVLLDDGSTDAGVALFEELCARHRVPARVVQSASNGGNILRQWQAGVEMAGGDLVWIAEADDTAHPEFLRRMAGRLEGAADAVLAFCDSQQIDEGGRVTHPDYKAYYADLGDTFLQQDEHFAAPAFLAEVLCPRNLILNLSSVLWRRDALLAALRRLAPEAAHYRLCADWRLYVEACAPGGAVHYVVESLNRHRRHAGTITTRTDHGRHLQETLRVFETMLRFQGRDPAMLARMRKHLRALGQAWQIPVQQALERIG